MWRKALALAAVWLMLFAPLAFATDHGEGSPVVTGQVQGNSISGPGGPPGSQWHVPLVLPNDALQVQEANPLSSYTCFKAVRQNTIRNLTRDMSPIVDMTGCTYRDLLISFGTTHPESLSRAIIGVTLYEALSNTVDTLSLAAWTPIRSVTATGVGDTVGTMGLAANPNWSDSTLDFGHGEFPIVLYGSSMAMTTNAGDGVNAQGTGSVFAIPLVRDGAPFAAEKMAVRIRFLACWMQTGAAPGAQTRLLATGVGGSPTAGQYPPLQYNARLGGRR